MLKLLWRVASTPAWFFGYLETQEVSLVRAALTGLGCYLLASLAVSLGVMVLTGSQVVQPFILFGLLIGVLQYAFFWALGGLILQQPNDLELRAWELTGWAWSVALFVTLSLLPAVLLIVISPLTNSIIAVLLGLGALGAFAWHVWILRAGLVHFTGSGQPKRLMWYVGLLFVLPALPLIVMFINASATI
ncbi:MAG: hypothetical protein AAF267_14140 [Deinococcota bacterium]